MSKQAKVTALPGTIPTWSFADRLRKARREYTTYTQQQMADALDVGLKAYSAWESGKNQKPSDIAGIAVKLSDLTGIPRTWFLGWETENPHPENPDRGTNSAPGGNRNPDPLGVNTRIATVTSLANYRHTASA